MVNHQFFFRHGNLWVNPPDLQSISPWIQGDSPHRLPLCHRHRPAPGDDLRHCRGGRQGIAHQKAGYGGAAAARMGRLHGYHLVNKHVAMKFPSHPHSYGYKL